MHLNPFFQTSSNCDCFFERYLPWNFVIPRADAKITEEIFVVNYMSMLGNGKPILAQTIL